MRYVPLFLFLTVAAAERATTWQSLRFGMTVDEVRSALEKVGITLGPPDAKGVSYKASPGWEFALPGRTTKCVFNPSVVIDKGGLESIYLSLDPERTDPTMRIPVITLVVGPTLFEALVAKYGPPAEQRGSCREVSARQLLADLSETSCNALWRAEGQTVEYKWNYFNLPDQQSLLLSIKYQMVSNAL